MLKILAIANQKGGVGKTTTAVNLGACLAARGKRILVADLDPQANATSGLGYPPTDVERWSIYDALIRGVSAAAMVQLTDRAGLDLLPSSIALAGAEVELVPLEEREYRLRAALDEIAPRYDCVLIDCPPSLGLLTLNALTAADGVIIPVQCEYLALEGLSRLVSTIDLVQNVLNPRLVLAGLLLTMWDPRTNLAQQVANEVRTHFPQTFRTIIPRSVRLSEAPSYGQSILDYDPTSKGAQAYVALAQEVIDLLTCPTR
ncbi:MAG: ParA family protein [Chloroflexota bacterium]|nr:MAG: ParA family protein [Chloroflexota bacterium]